MSHIVTFKYYVGVILFLEENYIKVLVLSLSLAVPGNLTSHLDLIG
jgi:hypothetical protein